MYRRFTSGRLIRFYKYLSKNFRFNHQKRSLTLTNQIRMKKARILDKICQRLEVIENLNKTNSL